MPRRVGLPGASELFRATGSPGPEGVAEPVERPTPPRALTPAPEPAGVRHTGRVRHDEKITVYVSSEELVALERLRLELRSEHGLAVDRGRLVRAAIASALAAVADEGSGADVIRRLTEQ